MIKSGIYPARAGGYKSTFIVDDELFECLHNNAVKGMNISSKTEVSSVDGVTCVKNSILDAALIVFKVDKK